MYAFENFDPWLYNYGLALLVTAIGEWINGRYEFNPMTTEGRGLGFLICLFFGFSILAISQPLLIYLFHRKGAEEMEGPIAGSMKLKT